MRENRTLGSLTVDSDPRANHRQRGRLWAVGVSFAAAAGVLGAPGAAVAAAAETPQSHDSQLDPSSNDDATPPPVPSPPSTQSTAAGSATRDLVVQWANKELGRPYRWGANGPNAFDCSGFTTYVFRLAQVQLPRTSQAQFRTGKPVSSSNIKPGDLVFWNTDGTGASHVGIAISPTEAISAGTHEGVRKHPIKQGYWATHFMGARSEL